MASGLIKRRKKEKGGADGILPKRKKGKKERERKRKRERWRIHI